MTETSRSPASTARKLAIVLENLLKDCAEHTYKERVACALGAELIKSVPQAALVRAVAFVSNKVKPD